MNTFDPATVRQAVAEFTPLRSRKFQDLIPAKDVIVKLFPIELAPRLPPKRKAWKSEDPRMDIFDAAGLAVAFWPKG